MYRNSLTSARLFAFALLLFFFTGMPIWLTCLIDHNEEAFDTGGLILLGLTLGCLILSLLFFRRLRWAPLVLSILLHAGGLALLTTLLWTVPAVQTPLEKVMVVALTVLGAGLLLVVILVLHSTAMRADFAASQERVAGPHKHLYAKIIVAILVLLLAIGAWQIVPLLVAQPTITVDYLAQANQASKPPNYDPNQNAAPPAENLLSQFVPLPEAWKDKSQSWPTDSSLEQIKVLEEWAAVNEPSLSALARVARWPYSWHEMKSTDGALSGTQVPDLDHIRDCARGVLLLAKYQAARGDAESGLHLLTDLHGLAIHLAKGSTLVEQMVGVAVCQLSYDAVLAILDRGTADASALRQTLEVLAARLPSLVVPRFSEMEHLYERDNIQRLFTDDGQGNGRLIPAQLYRVKKNRAKLYAYPISYLDAVRICLTHPDRRETLELAEVYFMIVKDLAKQTPWDLHVKGTSYETVLKKLLYANYYLLDSHSGIGPCIQRGWRGRVSGAATTAVLAILVHKAQGGRLPESLRQLVDEGLLPGVPMDPYSGAPLIYKVQGDSFTLYSVGEDFADDGGQPCEWDEKSGDHVFWPMPAPIR